MVSNGLYQTLPRPWVMTNGCFDVFGIQHAWLLNFALRRAETGSVIVAIDSDKRINESKGRHRPVLPWEKRAVDLCVMGGAAMVVGFRSDNELVKLYDELRPEYYVRGYPKTHGDAVLPFNGNSYPMCPLITVPVIVDDDGEPFSTTSLVRRVACPPQENTD
jgi:bifunctional ADP-heptose synthase (sugar kinase/adenylyltransferase)